MKNLLVLCFFLYYGCVLGQYSTKTIAQNRHLKIQLRYKTKIAFNEEDENLFSLIITNKTKRQLHIKGVSWSLDGKDYKNNQEYATLNPNYFNELKKVDVWRLDPSFNYDIAPKTAKASEKTIHNYLDLTKKCSIKTTNRLKLLYEINNKTYQIKNTIKNINFELTAFDNYTAQQMADSIKISLLKEKKEQSIVGFLTHNPAVWDYIDIPKLIQYLLSDTIKSSTKCQLLPVMKVIPAKYKKEKQILHAQIIGHIYQKKEGFFHELRDYWDDDFLIPTVEVFEKADEDLYCYATLLDNHIVKEDSVLNLRIYEALNKKKETFFAKYITKKDTLEHFNEWMQIVSINKSKQLIPYLKVFLGDTSQVLDASYTKGTYDRNHFCLYREEPQVRWSSRHVCPPEPNTVEQFALDAIYKILGKQYCTEVRNAASIIFQKEKPNVKFDYYSDTLLLSESDWNEKKRMLNEAAHYLALQMLKE